MVGCNDLVVVPVAGQKYIWKENSSGFGQNMFASL
jgi:hypothetical protein